MADNQTTEELTQRIAELIEVLAENNASTQELRDRNSGLSETQIAVNKTGRANVEGLKNLAETLRTNNEVGAKLKESILRADQINTRALGSNITLQKVIDANSAAINNSNIGYLRAAEAFIANFEGGVRKTEGGTLRLTEQLIRTGQDTKGMIAMNNDLLGMTGRNYDALSKVNDAVLESSDTYTISTGQLVDGLNKLAADMNKFSMFGPSVAANIKAEFTDVLAKFQGLNVDSMGSFFSLLEPSLDKIGTREMLGISDFAEQFARGEATSEQIQATMQSVGQQIQAVVASTDNYAVAAELVQKQFGVTQQQATELVNISRTLAAGPDDAKNLQSTQEEQLETLKNQEELANEFYQKIAPQGLAATVALYAPAIQTVQAINGLSMILQTQGQSDGAGGLLDSLKESKQKPPGTPGSTLQGPPLPPTMQKNMQTQTQVTKSGFSKLGAHLKGIKTEFKSGLSGLKNTFKGGFKGTGLGSAALMLGGSFITDAIGGKMGETGEKLMGGAATGMNIAGMGKMLGFAAKGATPMAIAGSVLAEGVGMVGDALEVEKGGAGDTTLDVVGAGLQGAAYGAILGPVGAAVGGGLGLLYGGISEWLDWDGERAEQEKKQKEATERMERELRQQRAAKRAEMAKSDFVLMSIIDRVQSQQADYMRTANAEHLAKLTEAVDELKQTRMDNAVRDAGKKSKDLNK